MILQEAHQERDEAPETLAVAAAVYGDAGPELDDPAEAFHEGSKLYPSFLARSLAGSERFAQDEALRASSLRPVRRGRHRAATVLPAPELPPRSFGDLLSGRSSTRSFAPEPLSLDELSAILFAAYGAPSRAPTAEGFVRRTVPSGGALYPLEIAVAAVRVAGLAPGLYHLDPLEHTLEDLTRDPGRVSSLLDACLYPEAAVGAAALILISAVFWRSRVKYGLRGYRFVLLEAGHVAQNLLLAAEACELGAVLLGGFYDAQVDEVLDLDGVNESTLLIACLGRKTGEGGA